MWRVDDLTDDVLDVALLRVPPALLQLVELVLWRTSTGVTHSRDGGLSAVLSAYCNLYINVFVVMCTASLISLIYYYNT